LIVENNLLLTSVGAKANVLLCVGLVRWDAALLILLKRWHFVLLICSFGVGRVVF
jgi:hypothetical protein